MADRKLQINSDGDLGYWFKHKNEKNKNGKAFFVKIGDKIPYDFNDIRPLVFEKTSDVLANELIENAKKKDKVVTNDLKDVVSRGTGHLEGLDKRIKSFDSLKRKLEDKSKQKGITPEEYSKKVTDVLRYTNVSESDNLADDYFKAVEGLNKKGYSMVEVTNTFNTNGAYRGINTLVKDKSGYVFELQFHTPKSLEIKEINHKLYEEWRLESTSTNRKKELSNLMKANAKSIEIPSGIDSIKNIERKE